MPEAHRIERRQVDVNGRPATVYVGGDGPPLLLIHGGWGSAPGHWSRAWELLAEHYRVVAPELPGFVEGEALGSYEAYGQWSVALLDALGIPAAWCVGNSFGGSVAWVLGSQHPERCQGVIIVNGLPPPAPPPAWMIRLGHWRPARALMLGMYRRVAFTRGMLDRAFVAKGDADVPAFLAPLFRERMPRPAEVVFECMGSSREFAAPRGPLLLLWGQQDRGPGTSEASARKFHARLPGSQLVFVPHAGHLPQWENPARFVQELVAFTQAAVPHAA
ncbi:MULTISPECIES: alpha/beta fold hydrolase [unclassified Corallococcus]|uniref:alpha/beta fold hydrolase n=1 Tax=unclassified Corallococcus TaxID=2685029 RepID=UPI001A8FD900|nr:MULTISPECIES: alpha/beta hydrolase [unclassified Corallococcus]MBN9684856.1 alpha/beta hydrolase [Corallococcus sp. NCSPR001]WAS83679.1 alpha/beta hydrolase [Corallococcus sp. NCRR]